MDRSIGSVSRTLTPRVSSQRSSTTKRVDASRSPQPRTASPAGRCTAVQRRHSSREPRWCQRDWSFYNSDFSPVCLPCKEVISEAEEEGFEPSIPRLEVLRAMKSWLFASVQKLLQVG